eukprot:NODE_2909_length_2122_cov_16.080201.p1 GENE.NODE_2909_length_2122_cov_16.080201~~NODE_2909_length_2122_cov_16.080201.p1  ORF type:complete len:612 (-),score=166.62 NODE_2909_length_2122_cov_16.080201:226-2061(-)
MEVVLTGPIPGGADFASSRLGIYSPTLELYEGHTVYKHQWGKGKLYRDKDGYWYATHDCGCVTAATSVQMCSASKTYKSPDLVPLWQVGKGGVWVQAPGLKCTKPLMLHGPLPDGSTFTVNRLGTYLPTNERYEGHVVYQNQAGKGKLYRDKDGYWYATHDNGSIGVSTSVQMCSADKTFDMPEQVPCWQVGKDGVWVQAHGLKCSRPLLFSGPLPEGSTFAQDRLGLYTPTSERFENQVVWAHAGGKGKLYRDKDGYWYATHAMGPVSASTGVQMCSADKDCPSPEDVPVWQVGRSGVWVQALGLRCTESATTSTTGAPVQMPEDARTAPPKAKSGMTNAVVTPPPPVVEVNRHRVDKEDVQETEYRPLVNFVDAPPPIKKSCSSHIEDMKPFLPGVRYLDETVEEAGRITQSKLDNGTVQQLMRSSRIDHSMVFSIVMYTFDLCLIALPTDYNRPHTFYYVLNSMLRKRNGDFLKSAHGYLYYLMTGLYRLPPSVGHVYRGIDRDGAKAARRKFCEGNKLHWSGFSSATPTLSVAKDFARGGGVVLQIKLLNTDSKSRDIRLLSALPREEEILLLPNIQLFVVKGAENRDGTDFIELMEMQNRKVQVDF